MSSFLFTKCKRQALLISHQTDEETGSLPALGGTGTATQAARLHTPGSDTPLPPPGCNKPLVTAASQGGETVRARTWVHAHTRTHSAPSTFFPEAKDFFLDERSTSDWKVETKTP